MRVIYFLLCFCFIQPPITPTPVPITPIASKCDELRRLISDCELAIKSAEQNITSLKEKIDKLDMEITSLIVKYANELDNPIPNIFLLNQYKDSLFLAIESKNKIEGEVKDLELTISCYKVLIDWYKKELIQNGC